MNETANNQLSFVLFQKSFDELGANQQAMVLNAWAWHTAEVKRIIGEDESTIGDSAPSGMIIINTFAVRRNLLREDQRKRAGLDTLPEGVKDE